MKSDKWSLIAVSCIIVLLVITLLHVVDRTEANFTELYFENPEALPSEIELGETYEFSFSITNNLETTNTYTYDVYIEFDDGEDIGELGSSSITLEDSSKAIIKESFVISQNFDSAKVIIDLDSGETIYFWISTSQD
ncbi:hypothetical protein HN865_03990 [Candidatus Woesearchaeota archaeon]|jgi:hypothetical protein|nr:hypothetical protein [archaeon]MBT3730849.1 hypothetical protein [archaeon]MBT4669912.1 hypothetical protein [archaeon]MBT7053272.1 hypothetical protein [archaeon]MBT7237993.1 hypothetical protein [Candidatus Woesearchaeota archaeon]